MKEGGSSSATINADAIHREKATKDCTAAKEHMTRAKQERGGPAPTKMRRKESGGKMQTNPVAQTDKSKAQQKARELLQHELFCPPLPRNHYLGPQKKEVNVPHFLGKNEEGDSHQLFRRDLGVKKTAPSG